MPLNISANITKNNITAGPATLFLGASGATPTVDVGAIGEDGASLEVTSDIFDVEQGIPRMIEKSFIQRQGLVLSVTSIEWNFDNLSYALGAGNTTVSGSEETFAFGGSPCPTEVALKLVHQMACSGQTMTLNIWTAETESGGVTLPFSLANTPHAFEYRWKAMRTATDWASQSLATDEQLFQIVWALT